MSRTEEREPCSCPPGLCPHFPAACYGPLHRARSGTTSWGRAKELQVLEKHRQANTPEALELARKQAEKGRPTGGPGTELKALLAGIGIEPDSCGCDARAAQMNAWGASCADHRDEIVGWLQEEAAKRGWVEKVKAGAALLNTAWFNPLDPYGSIVGEAIARAEAKGST